MKIGGLVRHLCYLIRKLVYHRPAKLASLRSRLSHDPTNKVLHIALAEEMIIQHNYILANAELRCAQFLGSSSEDIVRLQTDIGSKLAHPKSLDHNTYFRLAAIQEILLELNEYSLSSEFSILDIGGGMGALALFVPNFQYFLADPSFNGVSGLDLPFRNEEFNIVVACHVLEHIPEERRDAFLIEAVRCSKQALVLLNPFDIRNVPSLELTQLFYDLTGANWAKEHLEFSLPSIKNLTEFALKHQLVISIKPIGNLLTVFALEFCEYFGNKSFNHHAIKEIRCKLNDMIDSNSSSSFYPSAHMVVLEKPGSRDILSRG